MTGRNGVAANLETATGARVAVPKPTSPAAPGLVPPSLVVRIGDRALPIARPADRDEVALEPGSFLGPVELREVRWPGTGPGPPAPPPPAVTAPPLPPSAPEAVAAVTADAQPAELPHAGPTLLGGVAAPFVEAAVAIDLDEAGSPTGPFRIDAGIGLPGAPVASFSYASNAWLPTGPLPLPRVEVAGDRLTIAVDAAAASAVQIAGDGIIPTGAGTWTVPLPPAIVAALGRALVPTEPAPVGTDRLGAAQASLAEEPSERVPVPDPARALLEAILGIDLTALGVHVDPPAERAAAAAGVPAFTLGSDAYFGTGAFGTDSEEQAALLGRAIAQALEGVSRVVVPDESVPDPTQARSHVPGAAPVAPAVPTELPAPDDAAVAAEAETLVSEDAAQLGAEQEVAPAAEAPVEGPAPEPSEEGVAPVERPPAEGEAEPIELIMPPAPTEPGPAQQERIAGVSHGAGRAARRATDLPTAEQSKDAARGAVAEPVAETAARAEAAVAEALGKRAEPSPEIVALCERIRTSIRERRPIDEDAAARSDTQKVAQEAGQSLNAGIQSDAQRVEGSYAPLNNPPAGTPALNPTPVQAPPATVEPPAIGAEGGAPDAIPPENLSLDADRQATDARIESSGINKPTAQAVQEPPFTTVREGQAELATLAENGPNQVAARQQEAIDRSRQDMAALQLQAVEALNASRAATVGKVSTGQTRMVGSEEEQRAAISAQAQAIFAEAQTGVTAALEPLQANAMAQWDAGVERLSTEFHDHLAMVKRWIDDRHSGVGGWFVSGWDSLTGLPDEITDEYTKAEKAFGDGVCDLLLQISSDVNTVIAAAEALIESARERINQLFADLPEGLREWATQEQAKFNTQLDGLHDQATAARTAFVDGVSQKAVAAVAEVQAEVEQLREEAKGLIGKIADAIQAFIDDPIKAIIDGLLHIVGIPPPRFWALVDKIAQVISDIADDPESFINNLVDALRQGFEQFFDNFGFHVLKGFWDWLFSGLGSVGVQLPKDLSVGSLITFALQVMGITWPNIRKILVKYIGEENVALIEQAWQLVSTLIEKGPSGILDMIKERLSPDVLLETILKAAVDYLVENLIKAVAVKLISMLNPAGAIYQAIQLIYTVLKWIFQNAARIFSLVETVVGAMADVIAGNLSAVANAVEKALGMLIPPVIDFFAEWLGFGDLPIKIADIIKSLQEQVLAVIDEIIGWLVEQAKALLAAFGLGGDEDEEKAKAEEDAELGKVVPFSAAGEAHKVFVFHSGGEAQVMVASTEQPVTAKLKEWRDKLPDISKQRREKAEPLLDQADQLASQADSEADALAAEFAAEQAAANKEEHETPSDDTLESEEVTLASTLRELYKVFGERPDLAEVFEDDLAKVHDTAEGDVTSALAKLSRDKPERELAEWPTVQGDLAVIGGPISRSLRQPMHAGSGFADAANDWGLDALHSLATDDHAPLRVRMGDDGIDTYLVSKKSLFREDAKDLFEVARQALIASLWDASAPSPKDAIAAAFKAKWAADNEVDPDLLQEIANAGGDIVTFLQNVASGGAGVITVPHFQHLWKTKPNKDFVKGKFRGVARGHHEWIPTGMIPKVVARAASPEDGISLYKWVRMQDMMRTDTAWVIFNPSTLTQTVTPPSGPAKEALTGHVGAVGYRFYPDDATSWLQARQDTWHQRLRDVFEDPAGTPADVVSQMEAITLDTVWNTQSPASGMWARYYVKVSEGGGPKTLADLQSKQAGRFKDLLADFKRWKDELVKA